MYFSTTPPSSLPPVDPAFLALAHVSPLNRSLLSIACDNGQLASVKWLIECGVDANKADKHTQLTPLHHAAYNNNAVIVIWLIRAGANINATAPFYGTPLARVLGRRHQFDMPMVRLLLELKASPRIAIQRGDGKGIRSINDLWERSMHHSNWYNVTRQDVGMQLYTPPSCIIDPRLPLPKFIIPTNGVMAAGIVPPLISSLMCHTIHLLSCAHRYGCWSRTLSSSTSSSLSLSPSPSVRDHKGLDFHRMPLSVFHYIFTFLI
jgi:hypothetical protein